MCIRVCCLLAAMLALSPLWAAAPLPSATPHRVSLPLLDGWEASLHPAAGGKVTALPPVTLPHRWAASPALSDLQGAVWYTRTLALPENADKETPLLVLDQVVGQLDVYLDDVRVAGWAGNGLPCRLPLPSLTKAPARLTLRLDRARLPEALHAGCGLGAARLELTPPVRIDALQPQVNPALKTFTLISQFTAPAAEALALRVRLTEPGVRRALLDQTSAVALTGGAQTVTHSFVLKRLPLWAPAAPKVLQLQVTLLRGGRPLDEWTLPCGACALTIGGGSLQLNGAPFIIKGLRLRGGLPPLTGPTLRETLETELRLARQAGFNALMADGPALPDALLTAADAAGLLVLGDLPPTWNPDDPQRAPRLDLDGMLAACGQHPCLAAWSWDASAALSIDALREKDHYRLALVRAGTNSQAFGPLQLLGTPFTALEQRRDPLEAKAHAALLEKILGSPQAMFAVDANLISAKREDLNRLRGLIESIRRSQRPLGYLICAPSDSTLTGLCEVGGAPTRYYTIMASLNQACILTVRAGTAPRTTPRLELDTVFVNDLALTGEYRLYGLVAVPDGTTAVINRTVLITGDRLQPLSPLDGIGPFPQTGTYYLQIVLARNDSVLTSVQATIEVK